LKDSRGQDDPPNRLRPRETLNHETPIGELYPSKRRQLGLPNISSIDFFAPVVPVGAAPGARLGTGAAVVPRFASPAALISPLPFVETGVAAARALELEATGGLALELAGTADSIVLEVGAGGGSSTRGGGASSGSATVGTAADATDASSFTVVDRGPITTSTTRTTKAASMLSMPKRTIRFFEEAFQSLTGFVASDIECAVWAGSAVDADGLAGSGVVTFPMVSAAASAGPSNALLGASTTTALFCGVGPGDAANPLPISIAGADGCAFLSAAALSVPAILSAEVRAAGVPNSTRMAASFATFPKRCAGFFLRH
jgi:hypothetical protein